MGHTPGSLNKQPPAAPDSIDYTTEQRLEFIATLIVDRILDDQTHQSRLLDIGEGHEPVASTT